MNPNETLRQIRIIVNENNNSETDNDDFDEMILLFESLDEWIIRGGFLPEDWQQKKG